MTIANRQDQRYNSQYPTIYLKTF